MDARVSHPGGSVTGDGRGWRRRGTDVDVDDVSVGLGLGQVDDGARDDTAKSGEAVASSCASRNGGGARTEACGAPVSFGRPPPRRFAAPGRGRKASRGARERGEQREAKRGQREPLASPESTSNGGGRAPLRRARSAASRHDSKGREGVKREGVEGYKGMGSGR